MTVATIQSDIGAQESEVSHCFYFFPLLTKLGDLYEKKSVFLKFLLDYSWLAMFC